MVILFGFLNYHDSMVRSSQPLSWLLVSLISAGVASAQTPNRPKFIDPREMGLDLTPGPVKAGGRTVLTYDEERQPVVGRVHIEVGTGAVILLPDGQLVSRKAADFSDTERKFEEADKDKLAKKLTEKEFPGFKSRTTKNFIFVYNTSEEFSKGTSVILETMLPGMMTYAESQRIDVHNPDVPLVVVMFRTDEEFQAYRRMPQGVVAYYHTLSNRVFMYEQSRLNEQRPDLAIQQSISTIAHEGAHQILHNIGVQQRLSFWPMWLSEGLAEYFAPTSVGARLRWKGAGQVNDSRMFELEQYLKSRAAEEPSGKLINDTVLAGRLTSTGYATAWSLNHYLAKNRRTEFNQLVRETSKLGPLETLGGIVAPGVVSENREQFRRIFGEDFKDIELKLVAHLKKLPYTDPFKDMPHFVAAVLGGDPKKPKMEVSTFHSPAMAQKWVQDLVEKLPEDQQEAAQKTLRMFPNRAAAEAYARTIRRK